MSTHIERRPYYIAEVGLNNPLVSIGGSFNSLKLFEKYLSSKSTLVYPIILLDLNVLCYHT